MSRQARKNGLYTYDHQPKFDMRKYKEINSQTVDIEKERGVLNEIKTNYFYRTQCGKIS